MKPIKLEIDGLNSFETKQVLNFDELSGGVFGIFGKTGSGKSTILDAITLSLYGKVERVKQNIDFINTKCSKATVSFEFEIFVSGKNKRYEVVRTFSKKKNGKDIDSSALLYEIIDGEKKIVEEGSNRVSDRVFGIIGLGVNEFEKCIALPQGEFAAFLQAKPTERTEIMSNIFDLSKYGERLSQKVKEKVAEYDKNISVADAGIQMVNYATDEKLKEIKNGYNETKDNYDTMVIDLESKSNEFKKLSENFEKKKKLQEIEEQLSKLEKERDFIEKLQAEISKCQVANSIKQNYEKLRKDEVDEKELTAKIAELNEIKLKKSSELVEAETEFENFKQVYDEKLIELNAKIARLLDLKKYEDDIVDAKAKKEETEKLIAENQNNLSSEEEENSYIASNLEVLQQKIESIDEFIEANKPDVDLSYALEQTKGVESEILLIDDMYKSLEKLIDQTNEDLKTVQDEYNNLIVKEQDLKTKRERIENSIEVAFEDVDTTNFAKLRSCDKQLEGMREVQLNIQKIDELAESLNNENNERQNIIEQINNQIYVEQQRLVDFESQVFQKDKELDGQRETREEMLGENVITLIAENLKIGDLCPVCSSRVIQKVYGEKNDLGAISAEIEKTKTELKGMNVERDKILASIISLKSRVEFEKAQISANEQEIKTILEGRQSYYQKYVDNNDDSEENFNNLYVLLQKTADSLEQLIELQDSVRDAERMIVVQKAQSGTKITLYKYYLEELIDMLYDLQKKKAEREFVIINVEEKYENLKEYKKQIAEGKNIELKIDNKKEERLKLRDEQFRLQEDKNKSDLKIFEINSNINLLGEKLVNYTRIISENTAKILSSGVPEGVLASDEKIETERQVAKLKMDYDDKQTRFESCKEELRRTESEYSVNSSILMQKQDEIKKLRELVDKKLEENKIGSYAELENCFADVTELNQKQDRVNEFNDNVRILESQKNDITREGFKDVDENDLRQLEGEIKSLNENVKALSEKVGKTGAELSRIEIDNQKLNELNGMLADYKHKYDLAKDLSSVLRGKALAEYVCEEYLQEITESANQKLGILMDGRYNLKFENKEFFVEDNFNDAKVRPASTLSGGETFVVSLSLALSISDAIAMLSSRSMDFFFLDEGFGTLDAELCAVVISSLYKLESQNLKIGLISHVAELEESIKNKVIVTKEANGSKLKIEHSL